MIKKFYKQWRSNGVRNIFVFVLIFISSMVLMGIQSSINGVNDSVKNYLSDCCVEDVGIQTINPLSQETVSKLTSNVGDIEDMSYIDITKDGIDFRIFAQREKINKVYVTKGESVIQSGQVILGANIFDNDDYALSGKFTIESREYEIIGFGIAPDYITNLKSTTDVVANSKNFCIAFISKENFDELKKTMPDKVINNYAVIDNKINASDIKILINEDNVAVSVTEKEDNPRILQYTSDIDMTKQISTVICICLIIIIAFIVGIYLGNIVKKESSAIGTLLALGIRKIEIILHYLLLPIIIVCISSATGCVVGFLYGDIFVASIISYYNFPSIVKSVELYPILMSLCLPNLLVIVVGHFMISRKLSFSPLDLIRGKSIHEKNVKKQTVSHRGNIRNKMSKREMKSNMKTYFLLFCGELLVIFLLVFAFMLQNSLNNYIYDVDNETKYEYMYSISDYKSIDNIFIDEHDAEKANLRTVTVNCPSLGKDINLIVEGIEEQNAFYDFNVPNGHKGIYISSATSRKFDIKEGDVVKFKDPTSDKEYQVECSGIVKYSNGLYSFMSLSEMNTMFEQESMYYNTLLTSEELDIDDNLIYAKVSSKQVLDDVKQLMNRLLPMCYMIIVISTLIFIGIMLLMLKLIVNNNQYRISMLGVLGYNKKEVLKIYYTPIVITVFGGLMIGFVISYELFRLIWPRLISDMQTYIESYCSYISICSVFVIAFVAVFISRLMFKRLFKRIDYTEILKVRE